MPPLAASSSGEVAAPWWTTPGERTHLQRTAQRVGGEITYTDVRTESANEAERNVHDPAKLAAALLALGGAS